jgi:Ca2+-binding EF-hand superfamily protein
MAAKGASVVRYTDFLVFICDPYYHDVLTKFQRALQHSGTAVNEVIATLNMKDTNSSGIISLRSFDDSLQACGIDLSPVDVERLSFRYDVELNQKVDIEQFFVLLRSLSTSTEESDVVEKSPEEIAVAKTLALLASRIRGMLDDGYPTQDVLTLMSIGSGQLDLKLLQTGAKKLDIDVPRNVARGMLRKMCLNVGGLVDSQNFLRSLHEPKGSAEVAVTVSTLTPGFEAAFRRRPDLLTALTGRMLGEGSGGGGGVTMASLAAVLKRVAVVNQMNQPEVERLAFGRALRQAGIELPTAEERELLELLGEASGGGEGAPIDSLGFLSYLRTFFGGRISANSAVDRLTSVIIAQLEGGSNMEKVFDEMDKDLDGELGIDDVSARLKTMGFALERSEVMSAMSHFTKAIGSRRNSITPYEFDKYFTAKLEELHDEQERAEQERKKCALTSVRPEASKLATLQTRLTLQVGNMTLAAQDRLRDSLSGAARRGEIDFHAFMRVVEVARLDCESEDVDFIFSTLDSTDKGAIRIHDVFDFLKMN